MKKRDLSDDEKELWKEFSKSTEPLRHQNQKNEKTVPGKKKLINSVNLKDEKKHFIGGKKSAAHVDKAPVLSALSMDSKLHTKMRQGKIRPEAKLDLHCLLYTSPSPRDNR